MASVKLSLTLPATTLEWLPKVAGAHKDRKGKPAPMSAAQWVFDNLKQVGINQGQAVNIAKSRGFIEFDRADPGGKPGQTEKVRITVESLGVDRFIPKPVTPRDPKTSANVSRDTGVFVVDLSSPVLDRLKWAVAVVQAYIKEGMLKGNEAFEDLESWAEDQLVRSVAAAYTELENRRLEEEELPEDAEG